MEKITRFIGKRMTIDGIVGTIYQERNKCSCEFVFRTGNDIDSVKMSHRYLQAIGEDNYATKKEFGNEIYSSGKRFSSVGEGWDNRNTGLSKAGIDWEFDPSY